MDVGCGHGDKAKLVLCDGNKPCLFWASCWTTVGSSDGLMGVVFLLSPLPLPLFLALLLWGPGRGGMALTPQVVRRAGETELSLTAVAGGVLASIFL